MTEKAKEGPAPGRAKPESTELAQLADQSQKILRKMMRSFKATWKLYRSSKTGLAGLGIVIGFLVMAVFAPILAPYNVDFTAPAEDIFVADSEAVSLETEGAYWTTPMGLTAPTRENTLERVMVYSNNTGQVQVFGVRDEGGIVIDLPVTDQFVPEAGYINYAHFTESIFFVLDGDKLREYEYYSFNPRTDSADEAIVHEIGFTPIYSSNLWNGYSIILQQARLALAFADEHNVWLMDMRPRTGVDPVDRTFESNITISNATIVGSPLVMDGLFNNGSMLIVPTDAGIMAFNITVVRSIFTGTVTNVYIGGLRWMKPYQYVGDDEEIVEFEPVTGPNMITFPYPYGAAELFGKEIVAVASTDGRAVAYGTLNGTVMWSKPLIMPSIREYEITDLYPSPSSIIVVGKTGDRGFIAGIDPATGIIRYNNSQYTSFEGYMNSVPNYISGMRTFLFSTDAGRIYMLNELLMINATFGAPGGGALTPVAYAGNVFVSTIIGGNYFALVTADNALFMQTLYGRNVAPLPPGTYQSGNDYILGTDYEGHDILTWLIYGTRAELMVGVTAAFFAVVIGTIVGLVAGFYSGFIDDLLMRITDVVLSLPGLVIILLFAAVFGPSLLNIIIIIAILSWAGIARVIRSVTLSLKERAFVDAAIIAGASDSRLIFRHLAPNVLPYTFLYMTFNISGAIVTEAILAFLGFGDVNYVTWGMMLQYLQISGHSLDAPWWLLPPGIAITLLSLAFYLIGRAFDEVVNPRLRKR